MVWLAPWSTSRAYKLSSDSTTAQPAAPGAAAARCLGNNETLGRLKDVLVLRLQLALC